MSASPLLLIAFGLLLGVVQCYDNGMGATPPMGWNTWCTNDLCGLFDICSDTFIREQALAMNRTGLVRFGYNYVIIDDCWSAKTRDAMGRLQPAADRFPYGMKDLADYVHSLGLKIGIYTDIGYKTCRNDLPGSFGHFKEDTETLAEWGVDFVKTDNCYKPEEYDELTLFTNFSLWLNKTGRPMLFMVCEWGNMEVQRWGAQVGQMYRIQMDHFPLWQMQTAGLGKGFGHGTLDIINYIGTLKPSTFVRPFGWMDPDFLEIFFPVTMNYIISRTEFSFWCLWAAPLIVATPLTGMSAEKREVMMNAEVIAIDQDPLGMAGDVLVNRTDGGQVWAKPLKNGDRCVILFNSGTSYRMLNITAEWKAVGFGDRAVVAARNLWTHRDLGNFTGSYSAAIDPQDIVMLRVKCVADCW